MNRRSFIKNSAVVTTSVLTGLMCQKNKEKPNVLFIAIDDLNDWIKPLHPGSPVLTPNLDRLFKRGVLFTRAYCSSPACNPSRASLLTGLRPSTTGIYGNHSDWRKALPDADTIPQHFMKHGYHAVGAGKIFHHAWNGAFHDDASFEDFQMIPDPPDGLFPEPRLCGIDTWIGGARDGMPISPTSLFDWGIHPEREQDAVDYHTASYAVNWLKGKHAKPWFLATGFFRPHMPCYAPQKYFDMYPLDEIKLPPVLKDDLSDIPGGGMHLWKIGKPFIYQTIVQHNKLKEAVRAYYACVTFMDAQLGRVLDALDNSPYKKDTIIVLWSDHGYHLVEKEHWGKFVLWEKATRMPFFISAPGVTPENDICTRPVSLLDIYPTLNTLCGLEPKPELEGVDLSPLLKNPKKNRDHAVVSTYLQNNHAVRSERYRYIRYSDGTEELYDHKTDPDEWNNVAENPEYRGIINDHRQWLPGINAPQVPDMQKPEA